MSALLQALHAREGRQLLALCGGGGKTTLLHALARAAHAEGKRSAVCSSTHILQPEAPDIAFLHPCAEADCLAVWESGRILATGRVCEQGKITMPDAASWQALTALADFIVCEADGAKNLPLKFPAAYEPVLPAGYTRMIAVAGLSALGQPTDIILHRAELARQTLPALPAIIDEAAIAALLIAGYGRYQPQFVLNQADDPPLLASGRRIAALLAEAGFTDTVITALKKGVQPLC